MTTFQLVHDHGHGIGVGEQVQAIPVELCGLCSTYFEKPQRNIAQPYVNRLICKVLEIQPPPQKDGLPYFSQYIPICPECTGRVKTYDRKRVELDTLKQEIVSLVLDTLLHIRPNDTTHLHAWKFSILEKWAKESHPPSAVHGVEAKTKVTQDPVLPSKPKKLPPKKTSDVTPIHTKRIAELLQKRNNSIQAGVKTPQEDTQTTNEGAPEHESAAIQDQDYVNDVDDSGGLSVEGEGGHLAVATTEYIAQHIQGAGIADDDDDYQQDNDDDSGGMSEDDNENDEGVGAEEIVQLDSGAEAESDDEYRTPEVSASSKTKGRKRKKEESGSNPDTKKKRKKSKPNAVPKAPQHVRQPFFCEACGCVFSKLAFLRRHVTTENICKSENGDNVKECPMCSSDFSSCSWLDLKFHIDIEHPNTSLDRCRFCKREFLPNTMVWHQCEGLDVPPVISEFPCDYCDKLYHSSGSLSKHMYRAHISSSSNEKAFKCDICNRTFISNSILEHHKKSHNPDEILVTCEICGIKPSKKGLKEHMKIHSEKKYACDVCGKRFLHQTMLKIHTVVHTKEYNHKCDICEKKFKSYSTMTRHWKRHVNPLPGIKEICQICNSGTAYRKLKTLKRHMRRMHPGTAQQIEICSRPDNPDEEVQYSQSKTPIPRKSPNPKRKSSQRGKRKPEDSEESSNEDEDEEFDSEEDVSESEQAKKKIEKPPVKKEKPNSGVKIEAEVEGSENDQVSSSPSPARSITMNTRLGGKRIVGSTKGIGQNL